LWTRIRFSLLALLVLMTLVATGVGFSVLAIRSTNASAPQAATVAPAPAITGTLQLWQAPQSVGSVGPELTISTGGRIQEFPVDDDIPSLASPAVSP
jgi:hypothetical protein